MKLHHLAAFVSWSATAAMLAPGTHAQSLVGSVNGPAASAEFGKACIEVPDQDGDGYKDLLVGAPGFNSQRGAVYCLSGAFLAFGTGAQTLWFVAPAVNPGDRFGTAIANVGDVTSDGVSDFLVGQPGYDRPTAADVGAVRLINGSSHTVVSLLYGELTSTNAGIGGLFGSAIAACGDSTNDGKSEVVVGAPGSATSYARMMKGADLTGSGSSVVAELDALYGSGNGGNEGMGTAIASGFDLDGDGYQEFVVTRPGYDSSGAVDSGYCMVCTRPPSTSIHGIGNYISTLPGERLGDSVDASRDYDGDGVVDILVGAPNSLDASGREGGRVVVLSGARLLVHTPPYEIRTLRLPYTSSFFDFHFGAAVCASRDLNNDGVGEIMVGAPGYTTVGAGGSINNKGLASIFSGATGERWASIAGNSTDVLGDAIGGAIQDFDGDGFKEFVFAGSRSDAGGVDSGVVKCYRLFPITPATYCTGKLNSAGCTPAISFSGSPKAGTPFAPFLVTAANIVNQKTGLLFYSHTPVSVAFQGGFKCVASNPSLRTPPQNSGGSASGSDCTGTYSFDFNTRIHSGVDSSLVAGAEIYAQYWSRDPATPSTTSLTNALRFVINP